MRGIISNFVKTSPETEQQVKTKPNLNRRASFKGGRRGVIDNQIISDGYDCCKSIYRNVVAVNNEVANMLLKSHTFITDALENSSSNVLCAVYIFRTFLRSPSYLQNNDDNQGKNFIYDIDARYIKNLYYNEKDFQMLDDYCLEIKEYIESEFASHWKAIMDTMIAVKSDLEQLDVRIAKILDLRMDVSNCLTGLNSLNFEVKNSICLQSNVDQICRWITYSSNLYHVEVIEEVKKILKGLKGRPEQYDTYCSYLNQKLHSIYAQATKKCEYVYAYQQGNIRAMRMACHCIKQNTKDIKEVLHNNFPNCVKFQRVIQIIKDSFESEKSTLGDLVYNEISCYHKNKRLFHIACNSNFSNWRSPKMFLSFLEFYKDYCVNNSINKIEETYDEEFIASCLYHFTDVVQSKFSLTTRYFYEYFADINKNVSLCLNQFCDTFAENQENICKQYDLIFPAQFKQHNDDEYKDTNWLLYSSLEKTTKIVRNVNQVKYEVATFKVFDEIFDAYTFDFYTKFMHNEISCAKCQEDLKMKADIISQKMHNFLIYQKLNTIESISKDFDTLYPNENDKEYISVLKNYVYSKYEIYIRVYLIFKLCDVEFFELRNLTGIYNCFGISN